MDEQQIPIADPWLAQQLGCEVVSIPAERVTPADAAPLAALLRRSGVGFAYTRVPVHDVERVAALCKAGFCVVDVSVTLERVGGQMPLPHTLQGVSVRPARPGDEEALAALARRSFRWSRFHLDPNVGRSVASAIKEAWVRSYFAGTRGQSMSVAVCDGTPVGCLLALRVDPAVMVIDLVAVDEAERRRGVAALLTEHARRHFHDPALMRVGTQIANRAALGAYLRMGFEIVDSRYVLHLHATPPAIKGCGLTAASGAARAR
jgi:ribosomal protein S18 acetylase RimI-like enzyme